MRILIAPDKFKGTLTSIEASEAMSHGARRAAAELRIAVEIDECPVADGGEGFLEAMVIGAGAQVRTSRVTGPMGEPADARWGIDPTRSRGERAINVLSEALRTVAPFPRRPEHGPRRSAYIESAQACGLSLVPAAQRDPERASSLGVGQLILAAADVESDRIVIGLGGSATVDGGMGIAAAMGARFLDDRGAPLEPRGGSLNRIAHVIPPDNDALLLRTTILAACDVDAPLFGPRGAARVYAPQKGATPDQIARLDAGLMNLARACERAGLPSRPDAPGAGAAGGLGFGLATFCNATLLPGGSYVLDLLDFGPRAARANLVLTGEGMLDEQTAQGKAVAAVARGAGKAGVPVVAIVGDTSGEAPALAARLASAGISLTAIHRLTDIAPPDHAWAHAGQVLEEATYRAVMGHLMGSPAHG